jgi:type II secretory pathway pseudopilin PulG
MIVAAIIGVISAIALPNFATAKKSAMVTTCKSNLKQIDSAIIRYATDTGNNPTDLSLLAPDYIRSIPKCSLGNDYNYDNSTGTVSCPNADQGHAI